MDLNRIDQIDLRGKKVFVRTDFNVPLNAGNVSDETRVRKAIPTIDYALEHGARPLILASHLGRPQGNPTAGLSMAPVAQCLEKMIGRSVRQADDCVGKALEEQVDAMGEGEIVMLENLRFHPEEEENDEGFSRALASLADVYVNDAFGTAHRAHASISGMTAFVDPCCAGFLMQKEIEHLESLLHDPGKPFLVILGGAKAADKIGVIENLLDKASVFLIGGAMAYTFMQAMGEKTGNVPIEEDKLALARKIIAQSLKKKSLFLLPADHVITATLDVAKGSEAVEKIPENMLAVDIGPKTITAYSDAIGEAKTIFWNGPMGIFETMPFDQGTRAIAEAIAGTFAQSVIGGGDTAAAVKQFGLDDRMGHISTGGGASLALLEGRELPGLKALKA
jgi:phosphoglycerate kinase